MHLSDLMIWNFRKYGSGELDSASGNNKPGLHLKFNPGLNLMVGENDAGKTTIIDAIKLVLTTQSNDFFKIEYDDFHMPLGKIEEEDRTDYLEIRCTFRGMSDNEAKNFIEWLSFEVIEGQSEPQYCLEVFLKAKRKGRRVFFDIKAGSDDQGNQMSSETRALLKATYLKPLRDAENEMTPKRNSRLSQILDSHHAFTDKEMHHLTKAMAQANKMVEQYFQGIDENGNLEDQSGKELLEQINEYLEGFSPSYFPLSSSFSMSDIRLRSILEKLSLKLSTNKLGLGSHNLLFIAVELLLLNRQEFSGLKIALVEEIEAHIHPQAQLRLIEFLQKEADALGIQLLLTTHSTVMASKVSLANLILCNNGLCFSMDHHSTLLEKGDYSFLERFLDSTKSNLFFAKGVILVEGDAENLLIPTIADIIGRPLSKYGATIVNVGSTAFLRYSRIFQRRNENQEKMNIPVAVITDNDVRPDVYKEIDPKANTYSDCVRYNTQEIKKARHEGQSVKVYVSPFWTLEYDIALGCLKEEFYKAVLYAKKIQVSDKYGLTKEKKDACNEEVRVNLKEWQESNLSDEEIAFHIYYKVLLADSVSKSIVAQCLAQILINNKDRQELKGRLLQDQNLRYIIDAIMYATGGM